MNEFIIKENLSSDIENELEKIGFDKGYKYVAADKFRYKNLKIIDLTSAQANIIKQTALTVGADCATNRNVITGTIEKSDVLLGGSLSQLKKICEKLKQQPFKLPQLGEQITELLKPKSSKTKLVGILNVTPDSFSDGGLYQTPLEAQKHLIEMIADGADMIDIGAESTRPNSTAVNSQEQIARLKPILNFIQTENIQIPISIDTRDSEVADFALNNSASIINDVSGFDYDNNMPKVIAKYNSGVIIQHSLGTPENMQDNPVYSDVVEEIYLSLKQKVEYAKQCGNKNIIIDPGIGFGKTKNDNFEILDRIVEFYTIGCPVMVGVSRKSFLGVLGNDNSMKDTLSAAISYPLIKKGVDYLRVHNIKLHKNLINI